MEYANWFVVVMGVGIVFFGLIVLIIAVTIMGKILGGRGAKANVIDSSQGRAVGGGPAGGPAGGAPAGNGFVTRDAALVNDIANDMSLVAVISAAIADDMGTDISGIRIHSIKKVA